MTCLYCGKKLGFFSRYKDTPFCSEEHLRAHQDEMERALMERLGSKISAQSGQKELSRELPREDASPLETKPSRGKHRESAPASDSPTHFDAPLDVPQPSARLANASRRGEVRNFPSPEAPAELAPTPAAERPIDKRALLDGQDAPVVDHAAQRQNRHQDGDPREGNICQDFFESEHEAASALEPAKPWFAPSTFAIIVQADFCTPTLPDLPAQYAPAPVEDEFQLELDDTASAQTVHFDVPPPTPADAANFEALPAELPLISGAVPTGMPTIASLAGTPAQDIWEAFPIDEGLFEIELATPPPAKKSGPAVHLLGGRPELPMRPRHRYPYPGSDLNTRWQDRAEEFGTFPFTSSDEWGAIEPAPYRNVLEDGIQAEKSEIQPQLEVQLSLSALCAQVIAASEDAPFERDPDTQPVVLLTPQAGLYADAALGEWAMSPHLPAAKTSWQPHFRFPKSRSARPMPAVNFPSLFQLNPAMPPRPEGVLHG